MGFLPKHDGDAIVSSEGGNCAGTLLGRPLSGQLLDRANVPQQATQYPGLTDVIGLVEDQ